MKYGTWETTPESIFLGEFDGHSLYATPKKQGGMEFAAATEGGLMLHYDNPPAPAHTEEEERAIYEEMRRIDPEVGEFRRCPVNECKIRWWATIQRSSEPGPPR